MAETQRQQSIVLVKDANSIRSLGENPKILSQLDSVASKYLTPKKMVKIALLAAFRQPALYKCTQSSFIESVITAGELGLDFGGITGQGYLIAYGNKNLPRGVKECKFMPGYQGFIELAYRTGQIEYIDSQLVFANDKCEYQLGSDPYIRHTPLLSGDRGPLTFGYGIVILKDSTRPKIEFMTECELLGIKARSRSGNDGPWKTDLHEMCRKTLIRRIWKYIPKTPEVHTALECDNQDFESFDSVADKAAAEIEQTMGSEPVAPPKRTRKPVESAEVTPTEPSTTEAAPEVTLYHCSKCNAKTGTEPEKKQGKYQCPSCLKLTMKPDGPAENPDAFMDE